MESKVATKTRKFWKGRVRRNPTREYKLQEELKKKFMEETHKRLLEKNLLKLADQSIDRILEEFL